MTNINIRNLFKLRTQRKFRTEEQYDGWITDILKRENNTEFYINSKPIEDSETIFDIKKILEKGFYISAIFYCGNIFTNRQEKVCLFIFDKEKPKTIKLGYQELQSFDECKKNKHNIEINTNLPKEYRQYIFDIENWINNGKKPKDFEQNQTFGEIKYERFSIENEINPFYYLQIINSEIHLEKNAKLSDYAELIFPKNLKSYKDSKDMNARVITAKTYSKVFKFSDIDTTWRTNTVLKKNDILINSENYIYLHEEEYKTPVYVSPINQLVIRAKEDVNIKALYCILKLDNDLLFDNITSDMPVIAIKEDNNYDEIFAVLTGKKHEYEADLLDENLEQALRSCVLQQMQDVIKSDLKEIERCYSGNAYKAAIVLCGSVLEAFLYDWLKEGNIQIKENWDLKEYITQIENACWPKWEIGAKKATDIRKSRNLIHPEKYVKDFSKIDQKLCDDIIKALDYVTKTRSKIKFNN